MPLNLVYFGSSTFSSTVYDGGANINSQLLKYLSRKGATITLFCTNLSFKVMFHRGEFTVSESVIVREHSDESPAAGMLKNTLAVFRNQRYKELLKSGSLNYIFSGSDFWPDVLPALYMKLRNPSSVWTASFYLFAPKPWSKKSPYNISFTRALTGFFYWLTQVPAYYAVRHWADFVLVTSEPDVKKFITKKRPSSKIVVAQGGVDIGPSSKYFKSNNPLPVSSRKYDACFLGRFHYQKGVLELIDIWEKVCALRPSAKLAMIGCGALEKDVKKKIAAMELGGSINLLGFMDGPDKHAVFKNSKIIVHPATYDSGGMAACEAMAWGLPGVSFDLKALKTYYPQGMLKTPCFDLDAFARNILRLLDDKKLYSTTSRQAVDLARQWDWTVRSAKIIDAILNDSREGKP